MGGGVVYSAVGCMVFALMKALKADEGFEDQNWSRSDA
jgi:hypothetical protein